MTTGYNTKQQRHKTFNWDGETWILILDHEDGSRDAELFDEEPTQDLKSGLIELLADINRGYWVPEPEDIQRGIDPHDPNCRQIWHAAPLLTRCEIRVGNINGGDSAQVWEATRSMYPED